MMWVWKALLLGCIAYALLCVCIYAMQASLLYFPDRDVAATPTQIGLTYQDVALTAEDGTPLHGWFIPADNARAVVLFFHGNAGNISHRLTSIRLFNTLGLSVFIIDYRGYGRSQGAPTEQGTYQDAEAAWRYLTQTRNIAPETLIVFGRSLGGAIAAWLAQRHPPAALIVESSFSALSALAGQLYPYLPVRWLSRFEYPTAAYVGAVDCPVLVVHSEDDELIPITHGRRIFAAAAQPKRFLSMHGSHNDGFLSSGALYVNGLKAFVDEILSVH